jgi:hypothetical protein
MNTGPDASFVMARQSAKRVWRAHVRADVPAVHILRAARKKDVNAQHKAGHGKSWADAVGIY